MCDRLHSELTTVAEKCEQQNAEFDELNEKLQVMCQHWCKKSRLCAILLSCPVLVMFMENIKFVSMFVELFLPDWASCSNCSDVLLTTLSQQKVSSIDSMWSACKYNHIIYACLWHHGIFMIEHSHCLSFGHLDILLLSNFHSSCKQCPSAYFVWLWIS